MVLAAQRSYRAATRLARASRPSDLSRAALARRLFAGCYAAGLGVLGLISLFAPSQFGQPGASTLRTGWPSLIVLALVTVIVLAAVARRRRLEWIVARVREPLLRPLQEDPHFEEAADALASCPAPLRTRFALAWVWGPILWAIAGATFAFSSAYYLVDAVLARFRVGLQQPLYAAAFALLSLAVFATAAGRLATWRFAASVHKEVATGYTS